MTPNPNEAREREALIAFLNGSAPLDGVWFGEKHPGGPFWWRSRLTSLEATSSAPIGDSTDSGLDRAVAASVDPKWLPVNAAGRAVKMLTAYAELVKATGKYAEMHYIPEIEYVIAEIEGAGEIVLPAWLRNGYETAEATQPASDATARTESAPATAEPAQAEARAPISDVPLTHAQREEIAGAAACSYDPTEVPDTFRSWVVHETERHLRERAVASASQRDSLVEAARNAVDAMASAREMLYVEGCFTTSEEIDAACAALRAVLPKDKP